MAQAVIIGLAAIILSSHLAAAGEQTVTLAVENMTCVTCPYIVKQSLAGVPGVIRAEVSFENKTAAVTFDDNTSGPGRHHRGNGRSRLPVASVRRSDG